MTSKLCTFLAASCSFNHNPYRYLEEHFSSCSTYALGHISTFPLLGTVEPSHHGKNDTHTYICDGAEYLFAMHRLTWYNIHSVGQTDKTRRKKKTKPSANEERLDTNGKAQFVIVRSQASSKILSDNIQTVQRKMAYTVFFGNSRV